MRTAGVQADPLDPISHELGMREATAVDGDEREEVVLGLYRTHYQSLVRLAALLLGGRESAEDVVQEGFIKLYGARNRLRDPQSASAT